MHRQIGICPAFRDLFTNLITWQLNVCWGLKSRIGTRLLKDLAWTSVQCGFHWRQVSKLQSIMLAGSLENNMIHRSVGKMYAHANWNVRISWFVYKFNHMTTTRVLRVEVANWRLVGFTHEAVMCPNVSHFIILLCLMLGSVHVKGTVVALWVLV
jgi:hypothetical protein